jgi:hypothetical protein
MVMWELSLLEACLEDKEEDGVSSHLYLQDINIMKKGEMKCKFKISHLEEIIWLKFVVLMVIMDM